jgi:uncharacterized protein (TIGR03435 family)
MKVWSSTAKALGLAAIACGSAQAQTFAVASLKPRDVSRPTVQYRVGPDSFASPGTLKFLISQAYDVSEYQVVGGPSWIGSAAFELVAKADHAVPPKEIRLMLQALLADRFALKFHREMRTMQGYALSVDKNGPKLPAPKPDVPPESKGVIQLGGGEIWSRASTIKNLCEALRLELGFPVVDKTGIEGRYDFKLHYDETADAASEPKGSIFTALHEIGLRLDSRKVEIDVLVVASAEPPSGN